ncbi:MAG: hypothetical protein ACLRZH_08905 [Ruthenibacterium lactatiformans]
MRIRLYDVTRITRTGLVPHSAIDAEDGAITAVYDTLPAEEPGVRSVDAKGAYAAPGFIDIHLHGAAGWNSWTPRPNGSGPAVRLMPVTAPPRCCPPRLPHRRN